MAFKKKINPNKATKDDLIKLNGIGKSKANSIEEFIKKGGNFNNIEEFQAVAKLQPEYLNSIKETLEFEEEEVQVYYPDKQVYLPEYPVAPTIPIIPRESFSFKVKLTGLTGADNPYDGYQLIIGYNITGVRKSKGEVKYTIPSNGEVNAKIYYFLGGYLSDRFSLVVLSPDGSVLYDSKLQIDAEDLVEIGLTSVDDQEIVIKLNKQQTVNYEGYKVKVTSIINKGALGKDTDVHSYDIANTDDLNINFTPFGKVEDIKIEAVSAYGISFHTLEKKWADIPEKNGIKTVEVSLPSPTKIGFDLQLVVDPEELNNPYLDHKAVVTYDLKDPNSLATIRRVEKTYTINALGKAKVDIDHYGVIPEMDLMVKAPSGEVIGKRTITLQDIDANNEVEVKVPPRELAGVEGIETLPERPKKTTGRVIDVKGERKFENIQVIVMVAHNEEPEEKDFVPISIIKTENEGYFIFDTPKGYFTEAYATVGIPKKGNIEAQVFEIPVRLEEDEVVRVVNGDVSIEKRLFFPGNLILVVDVDNDEEENCKCNDCNLDFHNNKKVVDEFSFYTVVRTTEPDIQGYTLEEDGDMTVQDIIDIIPVAEDANEQEANIPAAYRKKSINKNVLLKHINDKRGLTFTTLKKALNESNAKKLREAIRPQKQIMAIGRHALDLDHAIDWDEDPTIYQATTLSHGHLLHFKQEWTNDGYSMGDLLYSLPLAPGQKKQIVVFDWERRETASRAESLDYQEGIYNSLSRDRDVNEIVTGSLNESMRGGSSAKTSSWGAGLGIGAIGSGIGALLGVAGGSSKASSSAWQNSSRNTALNDLQSLRDRTVQSANAVRSQRGTVIQTATQGERFAVETESVANYNHCHSMTIQYFEVLRHMKAQQRLSNVQECLFIPLIMSTFDYQKILRWREVLRRYVWSTHLRKGFDAIERIENDYEGSDLPEGTYAEENIEYLEGHLYIKFEIASPVDLEFIEEKNDMIEAFRPISWLFPGINRVIDKIFNAEAKKRNDMFYNYVAPEIAAAIVEYLRFYAVQESGVYGSETNTYLPLDTTLVSSFHNGRSLYVTLRQSGDINSLSRESIKAVTINKVANITLSNGELLADAIPPNTRVIISSGEIRYRTKHYSGTLFRKSSIMDDLVGYGGINDDSEKVRIATPLNRSELRNPRNNDLESANILQDHLNDNLEQFHKVIWMNMSPERRFMFLDGIQVSDYSEQEKYPLGVVRSVASVVENKVIGIVGNSLVMPVAPGFRLDPNTRGKEIDLISLYQPITPIEPIHITIPTKGVFAEAVMGKCNSCEEIEENRFWRWSQEPIPDSPTPIQEVSTDSRRSEPLDTTPTSFPSPMINIQNAPDAPDPGGLSLAKDLLGTSSFKDITGLEENQKNALEALKSSLNTAQAFGTKAGDMAALSAQLEAIKKAKVNGMIDNEKSKELTESAFKNYQEGSPGDIASRLGQIREVNEMVSSGSLSEEDGKKLTEKIVSGAQGGVEKPSIIDNPAVKGKIESGKSLEYSNNGETIKVEGGDAPAVDNTLLKFVVNFRKPETFKWRTGAVVDYKGHFGFDWLRDEYVNPIENVLSDLDNNPFNTVSTLCTDPAALKAEYLNGDPSPIAPHGNDYYPAWLALMPYSVDNWEYDSLMHKYGARLNLEIDEIDALNNRDNEIRFEIDAPADAVLSISPTKFTVSELMRRGRKRTKNLNSAGTKKRTYWEMEDAVTVKCVGGVLTSHAEIKVIAKGSDKEEEVGKLMVYQNDRIPKAEIVMVRVSYDDVNINLDSSYHSILKNNSFNQALIRAEVVADEKFVINNLDGTDPDVAAFKTSYPKGNQHNAGDFLDDIIALYQKLGNNNPAPGDKRTIIFITDENASSGGIAEGGYVGASFVWGNVVTVFGTNLTSESTFVHEIGHSLSLPHIFSKNLSTHKFYRGYTDNVMDYTTRYDGTAAKNRIANPNDRIMFFKWQWDIMRGDQSLIDNY